MTLNRYLFLLTTFFFVLSSCGHLNHRRGDGNITTQQYKVDSFDELDVRGNYEVKIEVGDHEGVEIEADENLFEFIEVYERNGRLVISSEESLHSDHGLKVFISCRQLNVISGSGASKISSTGKLISDHMEVDLSGAGVIDLDVECEELELNISGAGMIKLSGVSERSRMELSGAGNLNAEELTTKECRISLSGVGKADVYVTEYLDASVSGIGGVSYAGNPSKVNKNVSGIGKVTQSNHRSDKNI